MPTRIRAFVLLIASLTFVGAGCLKKPDTTSVTPSPEPTPVVAKSNELDVTKIKVGDTVKSMTVTSIRPASSSIPFGAGNYVIEFSGKATLKGTYDYYYSDFNGWNLRFRISSQDAQTLPTPLHSEILDLRFDTASAKLGLTEHVPSSGQATIVISDLSENFVEKSDGGGTFASVDSVIEKTADR